MLSYSNSVNKACLLQDEDKHVTFTDNKVS